MTPVEKVRLILLLAGLGLATLGALGVLPAFAGDLIGPGGPGGG